MKTQRILVTLAASALLFAAHSQAAPQAAPGAPAPAQAQPAPAASTASGELTSVDTKASTLAIKTAAGAEMTFKYNEQTKVTGAQKGVAGLATMTGTPVSVQFKKDGADNIATSIDVTAKQAPAR